MPVPKLQSAKHPDSPVVFGVFQRRQIMAENAPLKQLTGRIDKPATYITEVLAATSF